MIKKEEKMIIGKIKIPLTQAQENHFNTVEWLTDPMDHRREGRTHVLAAVTIAHAVKYPHQWILLKNHNDFPKSDQELLAYIKSMIYSNGPKIEKKFNYKKTASKIYIRYTGGK
jgi:hypothetical protein